jgi:hypothetical protein
MTEQAVLCINRSNCKVMINWFPLSGGHRPITVFGEEAWKMNCMSEECARRRSLASLTADVTPRGKGKEKMFSLPYPRHESIHGE